MASTLTPNLGLYKPTPNTSENYNLPAENNNKDILDQMVAVTFVANAAARTALTTFLYGGRIVFQRDTGQFWIYDPTLNSGAGGWTQASYSPVQVVNSIQTMTTTQRNSIATSALSDGLTIYNRTTNAFEIYDGTAKKWYGTSLSVTYDPFYTGPTAIVGTPTTPVTVITTASNGPTAYGNQRKIDRCQNGVLWGIFEWANSNSTGSAPWNACYSTDNGQTWTNPANIANGSGSATYTYFADGSFFIDLDDYAHFVFKDNYSGYLYYTRGTPNAARTAYTWSTAIALISSTGYDFPDVVAHRDPATSGAWVAHVACSYNSGSSGNVTYVRLRITAGGSVSADSNANGINIGTNTGNSTATYPSIDFRHNGDGKTVATVSGSLQPDLFIGWSAGTTGSGNGIRFKKATYASGSWTFGTEREINNAMYTTGDTYWAVCMFDGVRASIVGHFAGSAGAVVAVFDRDAADTTTTQLYYNDSNSGTNTSIALQPYYGSATYDAAGNIYIFGRGQAGSSPSNGSYQVNMFKLNRSAGTLGSKQVLESSGNTTPFVSCRRGRSAGAAADRLDYVYTVGTASPYVVKAGAVN